MSNEFSLFHPIESQCLIKFNDDKCEYFTRKTYQEIVTEAFQNSNFYIIGLVLRSDNSYSIFDGRSVYNCIQKGKSIQAEEFQDLDFDSYKKHIFYYMIKKTEETFERTFIKLQENQKEIFPFFTHSTKRAQAYLDNCYPEGIEGKRSDEEMVRWYSEASGEIKIEAQYRLGVCYLKGIGLSKNNALMFENFLGAAMRGHLKSKYYVGLSYSKGYGVRKSDSQANFWYISNKEQKPTSTPDKNVLFELGISFLEGRGGEKNSILAIENLMMAAFQGHAAAQFFLGDCYQKGIGINYNLSRGIFWLAESANNKNANAQYQLGICYRDATGVKKNEELFLYWIEKAAHNNHLKAQVILGNFYYPRSLDWLIKAADKKDPESLYKLGNCYLRGYGIEKNEDEALRCFKLADRGGNADAQYEMGLYYQKSNIDLAFNKFVAASKQGNANAQYQLAIWIQNNSEVYYKNREGYEMFNDCYSHIEVAKILLKKAVVKNHPGALFALAQLYENKIWDSFRNYPKKEILEYYKKAADLNHVEAQYNYALSQVEKNDSEAIRYFKMAADQGHEKAKVLLNFHDSVEEKVELDVALECYKESAKKGNINAQVVLGRWYREGSNNIKQNDVLAVKFFKKAAKREDGDACNRLGFFYFHGIGGLEASLRNARKWFKKAARENNAKGIRNLERLKNV